MDENEFTVSLQTNDGETITAQIIMVFADKSRDYIALMPETDDENSEERNVLLYRYKEIKANGENGVVSEDGGEIAGIELIEIKSDMEFQSALAKFEEAVEAS